MDAGSELFNMWFKGVFHRFISLPRHFLFKHILITLSHLCSLFFSISPPPSVITFSDFFWKSLKLLYSVFTFPLVYNYF